MCAEVEAEVKGKAELELASFVADMDRDKAREHLGQYFVLMEGETVTLGQPGAAGVLAGLHAWNRWAGCLLLPF